MTKVDNVEYLPLWKIGATAEERFLEIAMIARKNPERFSKVVVIYESEEDESKQTKLRFAKCGLRNNTELVGILDIVKHDIIEGMMR